MKSKRGWVTDRVEFLLLNKAGVRFCDTRAPCDGYHVHEDVFDSGLSNQRATRRARRRGSFRQKWFRVPLELTSHGSESWGSDQRDSASPANHECSQMAYGRDMKYRSGFTNPRLVRLCWQVLL